ncbi:hypothetical protein K458DRAFT_286484 [Lentithecium fluviatile CBS 122367]|uniref:Shugoshin n=1 Tax=Lentithecium fluviatile CBS 122367 TaxID=1168545 RepID=A0A6G1JNK5_9PLEO|nr:hypothetical protein K458DRAFT_286484 [Lentithecium fluviatile CBS 122367]
MARLNEPPIAPPLPVESGDAELLAAKRKFLRQNRELAKTNSQQSIRIRNLENDCSRLLADNLTLREQVVQLQNSLEARPSFDDIDSMKDRLEAKMQELGGLVAELGQLKKKDDGLPKCKSQAAATRRSPDERQWKSGLGLQEVENAMLPTITEDKFYPRKTLISDEMRDMDDSQSPDIGPPPVSRFESEEPIAFNPSPMPAEQLEQAVEEGEAQLPVNLETRRKRRESGPQPRHALFESPPEDLVEEPKKTVRAGAKRKFSVQEDEEKSKAQAEPFRFSRRNTPAPSEKTNSDEQPRPQSPERPALGSKPVNTDPILSPKKQRSAASDKPEKKPLSKTGRGRLTITRNVQPPLPPVVMPDPIPTTEIVLDSLPPKTPAPDDIFSPPSTEPSTSRPESKDTPPPGDLALGSQSGMSGRPSRRVRAQVSYKEPSLNTKMRRPGKELVDAVFPDSSRGMSVEPQVAPLTAGRVSIKQEPDDSSWKPLGVIGGRTGEEDGEVGSPLRQKLDRREGGQDVKADAPRLNSAAASHAISAMIEETRRKSLGTNGLPSAKVTFEPPDSTHQSSSKESQTPAVKLDKDDLAIFDFNESSPAIAEPSTTTITTTGPSRPRIDLAKAARSARRHSAMPTPMTSANEDRRSEGAPRPDGGLPAVHKRTASGTMRSSSSSNLGLGKSTTATRERERSKRAGGGGGPDGAGGVRFEAKNEGDSVGVGGSRAERAASRRKSMML